MTRQQTVLIAAISGFIAVAMGAFGAHGLKSVLTPELKSVFETAVQYQFYHTLALLFIAAAPTSLPERPLRKAAVAFLLGILLFSGSLYVLALSGVHWLGAITPVGGVAFLVGWLLVAYAAMRADRR